MKRETTFLKRFIAMTLALLMLVSNANLGVALKVSAAESDGKTYGEIMAENYDLTDAEKALLTSKYLKEETVTINALEEDVSKLISVDTDKKEITVNNDDKWVAIKAEIWVGNEKKEDVTLTNGVGIYTYVGNAFSVKAYYTQNTTIAKATQETLLNTAGWLKQGLANLDAVANHTGNLYALETAMPKLVELAGNEDAGFSGVQTAAIEILSEEMATNKAAGKGDKLHLSVKIDEYNAAPSKVKYLLNNGAAMKTAIEELIDNLYYIDKALGDAIEDLDYLIEKAETELATTKSDAEAEFAKVQTELDEAQQAIDDIKEMIAKVEQEISDVDKAISDANTALAAVNAQLAGDPENAELLAQKADWEETIEYLEAYKTAKAKLPQLEADFETGKTELENLKTQYETEVSKAEAQIADAKEMLDNAKRLDGFVSALYNGTNDYAGLQAIAAADWTVLHTDKGTALLKDGMTDAEYVALDELVKALPETLTAVEVKETLWLADADATRNMSMFNVTVKVVLNVVENNVVVEKPAKETFVTLAKNATKAEILAAIEASGIEKDALAAWAGTYVEGKFDRSATNLADDLALTEDITYTITYTPKKYVVNEWGTEHEHDYGYQLTLPMHDDALKAYDYYIGETYYAQGTVLTVEGAMTITRSEGEAYAPYYLYSIVANNYGDALAKEILTSGALLGDELVAVRMPKEENLKLQGGVLSAAKDVSSSYKGMLWQPYSYGTVDDENKFSGTEFSGDTASWSDKSAYVQYKLTLDNFTQADAQAILDLAAELQSQANGQKATLDALAGYYEIMADMDKTILGVLRDLVCADGVDYGKSTQAENDAIGADLAKQIQTVIDNNMDADGKLKIYNILTKYNAKTNGGLYYYYKNSDAVIKEINSLADPISAMAKHAEALKYMLLNSGNSMMEGYAGYADKIEKMDGAIASAKENLKPTHEKIYLQDENAFGGLVEILEKGGSVGALTASGSPYLISDPLKVNDSSYVDIKVTIKVPNKPETTLSSASLLINTEVTQGMLDGLNSQIAAKVTELLGDKSAYYDRTVTGEIPAVDSVLTGNVKVTYEYTAKKYAVKVEGVADDQVITIENTVVNLPGHPTAGWRYDYTIGTKTVNAEDDATYRFTAEELSSLFANGSYTIKRTEVELKKEALENAFEDWVVENDKGEVTGLNAKVDGENFMDFAMTLLQSGYDHIELNGEPLLYLNEEGKTEIKLQVLIDALLNDAQFNSDALIEVAEDGEGELLHATMNLGNTTNSQARTKQSVSYAYTGLDFTLYLENISYDMDMAAKALEKIKPYAYLQANNGVMEVKLTLPEKVYEVYMTALLASSNINKENIAEINSEIAFQFLMDYVDMIISTDANTTSANNTLAMLGVEYDLTEYEAYYQLIKQALTKDGVKINENTGDEDFDVYVSGSGQKAVNKLIGLLGLEIPENILQMIYECNTDGAQIEVVASAILTNTTEPTYQAVVIDFAKLGLASEYRTSENLSIDALKQNIKNVDKETLKTIAQGYDFAQNAAERIAAAEGETMVMLMDNVGSLVFNDSAILDLNGKTVSGDITVNKGTLIIIDSTMGDADAGKVTGAINGKVKILAGNYDADVTDKLAAGYVQENGYVHNALYTISEEPVSTYARRSLSGYKNIAVNISTKALERLDMDYVEFALALSLDLSVDMIFNYLNSAAFAVAEDQFESDDKDGYHELYDIQFTDLIGLLESTTKKADLVQKVLDSINVGELDGFVNEILADLLDFGAIKTAADKNEAIATYTLKNSPFMVNVEHITKGDYLTFGIVSNPDIVNESTISLNIPNAKGREYLAKLAGELDKIVLDETAIKVLLDETGDTITARGVEIPVVNAGAEATIKVDLTKGSKDYVGKIASILGYTDMEAFKAAFDNTSLGLIVEKLENYIDANKRIEGKVEDVSLDVLNLVTKVLKRLGLEDKKFGSLETDEYGAYDIGPKHKGTANRIKGVFASIELDGYLWIKLFEEPDKECKHTNTEKIPGEAATCTEPGWTEGLKCSDCGTVLKEREVIDPHGHAYDPKTVTFDWAEDGKSATATIICSNDAKHTLTVVATVEQIASTAGDCETKSTVTYKATATLDEKVYTEEKTVEGKFGDHSPAEAVKENEVPATCKAEGSFDEVVYCSACGDELSRVTKPIEKLAHTPAEAVKENEVPATCMEAGHYDEVVYCSVCGDELSRVTRPIEKLAHTDEDPKDHVCDVCGYGPLSDCYDNNKDGYCDWCGRYICDCAVDADNDHHCDACGKRLSWCRDRNRDHLCDICGKKITFCIDLNFNHKCDICGAEMFGCVDNNNNHICDYCGKELSKCADDNKDHKCDICGKKLSDCVDANKDHFCDICGKELSKCADENKDHKCDICGKKLSDCVDKNNDGKCDICGAQMGIVEEDKDEVIRVGGAGRCETARMIADELKLVKGIEKFDTIIYAVGDKYADALTGTYLANMKDAPILLYREKQVEKNLNYIKANLAKDGVVYILGGTEDAIPADVETGLKNAGIKVVRLAGHTRYTTNLEILDELGFKGGETVLVCTGNEYADALSASATGMPILLVNNNIGKLNEDQVAYLKGLESKSQFILIGEADAICAELATELAGYDADGKVERIGGERRYETCVMIADKYFADSEKAVVAYGRDFADALCGGTLAYAEKAPIVLFQESRTQFVANYLTKAGIDEGYVLGGTARIADNSVCTVYGLESADEITVRAE